VAITEDLMRVTLIALLAGAMTGWPLTTHASQDTAQRPMKTCEAESKGRRLTSSHGSILDVSGQKQQCNDGNRRQCEAPRKGRAPLVLMALARQRPQSGGQYDSNVELERVINKAGRPLPRHRRRDSWETPKSVRL